MIISPDISLEYPCLILALADALEAEHAGRILRRQGWDVYLARSGPEARRLARMLEPECVVLGTCLEGESGWLTCEKLTRDLPGVKVVLLDPQPTAQSEEFASFVGAEGLVTHVRDLAYRVPFRRAVAALGIS